MEYVSFGVNVGVRSPIHINNDSRVLRAKNGTHALNVGVRDGEDIFPR